MKRSAFTIIEILVVITLIGVVTAVLLPRLMRQPAAIEWPIILDNLNNIISFTRQEAIANQKVHRLLFHAHQQGTDFITIEEEAPDPENPGKKLFQQVSSFYFPTRYDFAEAVRISNVMLGKNTLIDAKGNAACYVIPDGLVQEINVQIVRKINMIETESRFIMNPFWGRFEFDEGK